MMSHLDIRRLNQSDNLMLYHKKNHKAGISNELLFTFYNHPLSFLNTFYSIISSVFLCSMDFSG